MQAEYQAGTNVIRKGMINSFVSMFKEERNQETVSGNNYLLSTLNEWNAFSYLTW